MVDREQKRIEKEKKAKEQYEQWREQSKAHWSHWRAWGSWFSWGSPVGVGICYALIMLSTGAFIWLIHHK